MRLHWDWIKESVALYVSNFDNSRGRRTGVHHESRQFRVGGKIIYKPI
jgi:hypothetical protein